MNTRPDAGRHGSGGHRSGNHREEGHREQHSEGNAPGGNHPGGSRRSDEIPYELLSDCEKISPILHRYVEGELDPIRSRVVESHIGWCPACLEEKEKLDLERLWLVENTYAGPALSARLIDKVMAPVAREAAARARARRWRWLAGTCAAACLLALVLGYGYEVWSPAGTGVISGISGISRTGVADGNTAGGTSASRAREPAVVHVSDGGLRVGPGDLGAAERPRLDWRNGLDRSRAASPALLRLESRREDREGHHELRPEAVVLFERSGLRGGAANPTFVDFGPHGLSCLPQTPAEPFSCEPFVSTPGAEGEVVGRARILRVRVTSRQGTRSFRFRFHDTFGIALRLRTNQAGANQGSGTVRGTDAGWTDLDPCIPDPNADGRTDSGDIAYGLQMLYGAQPPDVLDTDSSSLDSECEGSCLRA